MTELEKLREMLDKAKIPYVNDSDTLTSIDRIKYPNKKNFVCSAICGPYTYGGEHGQIEIMGLLTPEEEECDSVAGYLTADDVFQRIKKDYESKGDVIKVLEEKPQGDLVSRKWLTDAIRNRRTYLSYEDAKDVIDLIDNAPTVYPKQGEWILVSERLPDDLEPVNITWINHEPEPYYKEIKDKPFTATGVYFNGQWYWWSTLCTDMLAEYSHNFDDIIDKAIEIVAWQPLPEPYKKGGAK